MGRRAYADGAADVEAGDIPKREFGQTGEMLSVIGPGGVRLRMTTWEEATAIVRRCYDLGINYFDNSTTTGTVAQKKYTAQSCPRSAMTCLSRRSATNVVGKAPNESWMPASRA